VLFEPATVFKIGYPTDYALGIDEKWLQKYRIWVDRTPGVSLVALASWTDCNFIGNHESNTRSVTEKAVGSRL